MASPAQAPPTPPGPLAWVGPALTIVLAGLGTWVALGPGTRTCSGGYLGWTGLPPEWECRFVFGAGALIVWGALLYGWGAHLVERHGDRGLPRWIRRVGMGLLLLPLLPLLLLLIVGALLKGASEKIFGGGKP